MRSYIFPYHVSFGTLENAGGEIEYSLSDKNAGRLERSAKEGGRIGLDEDDSIRDIYDRVYDAVKSLEKSLLLSEPDIVRDALSWQDDDDDDDDDDEDADVTDEQIEEYLDELLIEIDYPVSLQLLERTVRKKIVQSNCESTIIEREQVQDYLKISGNAEKIIYVDGGKTLYHIPKKYSGRFIVTSGVETIDKNAFRFHTGITEIMIENGIKEFPEWAFWGCSSLSKITIPSSVKAIADDTFADCSDLSEVILSEGLTEIDSTAFRLCSSLKKLRVPATVKTINKFINSYWNGINEIYFDGMETTVDDKRGGDWSRLTMHVKAGSWAERYARENDIKYVIEK